MYLARKPRIQVSEDCNEFERYDLRAQFTVKRTEPMQGDYILRESDICGYNRRPHGSKREHANRP